MSDNWVVQNLENALETWNKKLAEIWQLLTQSPEEFKGGAIWNVIVGIHGAVQAIGLALLVLVFVVGVMKTCGSFAETRRPETALKLFIRFALAKGAVTYGLELMMALFRIVQGAISTIMDSAGLGAAQETVLPPEIITAVEDCGFFESIPPVGGDADRWAVHYGAFFCDDHDGIRALLQTVSLFGHCAHSALVLCRGAEPERGEKLSQKLRCRVFGRRDHCALVHHLLPLRCIAAHRQDRRCGRNDGVELYWGTHLQHAHPGRLCEDVRPDRTGDDGAVMAQTVSII